MPLKKLMRKLAIILLGLAITVALAHVPQYGGGDSAENAKIINNPLKSQVYYDIINEPGQAHYYKANFNSGDKLVIGINSFNNEFLPNLTIEWEVFGFTLESSKSEKEFEPFTPQSFYSPINAQGIINQTGTYYFIINSSTAGSYGLVIGYEESFTLTEWLLIPFDAINIYLRQGQNILFIFAPLILTILIGLVLILDNFTKIKPKQRLQYIAGLMYIGTGLMVLTQMINALINTTLNPGIIITLSIISVQLIIGYSLIKKENKTRTKIIIYALAGLITWSGLLIGPLLLFFSAFIKRR